VNSVNPESIEARFKAVRVVGWIRWIAGVILAVAISLLIVTVTVRESQVAACVRGSSRSNAEASNWLYASGARRKDGDIAVADRYLANVIKMRLSIAMPDGWHGTPLERGTDAADREAGCKDAYKAIFPFIR